MYDFIIVGAGTAGCVVANKLAENKRWRILLLEAGGEDKEFSDIPGMSPYCYKSRMNWGYHTTPQITSCQGISVIKYFDNIFIVIILGMINKQCTYVRGKVMGGSGTINGLAYTRGNKFDYDRWAEMGNIDWSFLKVESFFKDLEKWQTYGDLLYHGTSGPLNCNVTMPDSPLLLPVFEVLRLKGQREVDYNGKYQIGFSRTVYNVNFNKRVSGSTMFIKNKTFDNLTVLKNAFATKILLNQYNKAYGVEFIKGNRKHHVQAAIEVILSAGAINSPQILMLSGIGPKNELNKHGIAIKKVLPVGKNLLDHVVFMGFNVRTNISQPRDSLADNLKSYLNAGKPLTTGIPAETIGFLKLTEGNNEQPDVEYLINFASEYGKFTQFFDNGDINWVNYMKASTLPSDFFVYTVLLHPKSRGDVTLKSKNVEDFPKINPNFYSDSNNEDLQLMLKSIKYFLDLLNTEPMKSINATVLYPGTFCQNYNKYSDSFWKCMIHHGTRVMLHPIGTTSMGNSDKNSVVDQELKVHGVSNLRVVDAGVMPCSISGHTNGPTFMIGLKIAQTIIKQHAEC